MLQIAASVNADSTKHLARTYQGEYRPGGMIKLSDCLHSGLVPIVLPKVVDFGDSIDRASQLVGRLHQRHLKPTQCPTIRAISRKIDTAVRTTPTSHPTVASLPIVFREGQCSLWSTSSGLLRKPLQGRVLPGYRERGYEEPTCTACNGVVA